MIGIIEPMKGGELFLAQAIEACAFLLGRRVGGQPPLARNLPRKFGMRLDQRQLAFLAGILHHIDHRLV